MIEEAIVKIVDKQDLTSRRPVHEECQGRDHRGDRRLCRCHAGTRDRAGDRL